MKIYLFNPETGIYLGEDFADESSMTRRDFVVPPDATTVAPPQFDRGEIPVFDAAAQRWDVRSRPDHGMVRDA